MPIRCLACGRESSSDAESCPFCGTPLDGPTITGASLILDNAETMGPPVRPASVGMAASGTALVTPEPEALAPGALVAGRYRIVALLGRGGMGEVYRADDLKLGQAVALKFLPRAVERDPSRLEHFLNEVRTAREVSHPNVCRVHDLGEVGGRHFLSMEYIDGEDLASLLRRIGRLPSDKALDIARQLCAGLAAAHDRNVLHRDLKPANVMLDGRGRVRLTDFGLAQTAGARSAEGLAGTPAYMAPEQFEGQPASESTDIYALGLVLYEVFTGRRVFEADTIGDLRRLHDESRPPSLSSVIRDSDPAVERVIQRCLDKDPKQRPASAIAVAAALPGGDPLAAALAAGETPSPAMVAAAGTDGGLRTGVAAGWFAAVAIGLLVVAGLATRTSLLDALPKPFSEEVLVVKAQEMLGRLGYADAARDSAWALEWDADYLDFAARQPAGLVSAIQTGRVGMRFWFRSSPTWLIAQNWDGPSFGAICRVGWADPPRDRVGMRSVMLTSRGHLLALDVVPPAVESSPGATPPPPVDWRAALAETGIDLASLTTAAPSWTPPGFADTRMAWTAHYPDLPKTPLRIEAAAYRGKITYLQVVAPWTRPERAVPAAPGAGARFGRGVQAAIILALLVGGALVAWRNAALGRGDLRGAGRVAGVMFVVFAVRWLFATHHIADLDELVLLFKGLSAACLMAAWIWVLYVGLEPFVRRRWPHTLIGWSRFLAGRVGDPLVGRDVLAGVGAGLLLSSVSVLASLVIDGAAAASGLGRLPLLSPLNGALGMVDLFGHSLFQALLNALGLMFLLFLLRLALRRDWLMTVAFVVLMSARITGDQLGTILTGLAFQVAWSLIMVTVLSRFGLLAFTVAWTVDRVIEQTPLTTAVWDWHAAPTVVGLAVLIALTVWATRVALAGRSLIGTQLHGD